MLNQRHRGSGKNGAMNYNENLSQTDKQTVGVLPNNYQQEITVEMQFALALDLRKWQNKMT